jgi:hypothetical protein
MSTLALEKGPQEALQVYGCNEASAASVVVQKAVVIVVVVHLSLNF